MLMETQKLPYMQFMNEFRFQHRAIDLPCKGGS